MPAFMSLSQPITGTTLPGMSRFAGLPGAHGKEDVGVTHGLQLSNRGGLGIELHFHAHLEHQRCILVDGVVRDAPGGDHLTDHTAQAVCPLEDGDGDAGPAHKVGGGHAGGAAADDGRLGVGIRGSGALILDM